MLATQNEEGLVEDEVDAGGEEFLIIADSTPVPPEPVFKLSEQIATSPQEKEKVSGLREVHSSGAQLEKPATGAPNRSELHKLARGTWISEVQHTRTALDSIASALLASDSTTPAAGKKSPSPAAEVQKSKQLPVVCKI